MKLKTSLLATAAFLFAACGSDSKSGDAAPAPSNHGSGTQPANPKGTATPATPSKNTGGTNTGDVSGTAGSLNSPDAVAKAAAADEAAGVVAAPESVVVKQTIARAKAAGKKVVIKVSGAWCPPCQLLARTLEEGKDDASLKATLAKYEFLEVEERHFLNGTLSDFVPFQIQFYPSLVLLDPTTGRYSLTLVENNIPDFVQQLEGFAKDGSAVPVGYASIESAIANDKFAQLDPLYSLPIAFALEYPRAKAEAALVEFLAYVKAKKADLVKVGLAEADVDGLEDASKDAFYRALLSYGKISPSDVNAISATTLEEARTDAANGPYAVNSVTFTAPLAQILVSKGVVAAANECGGLALRSEVDFAPVLAPIPADAADETKKALQDANDELEEAFAANAINHRVVCTELGARAKTISPEAALAIANGFTQADIDAKKVGAHDLARIVAITGLDFDRAVQLETQYRDTYVKGVKTSLDNYDKSIAAAQKELEDAKAKGDAGAIHTAQLALDDLKNWRRGKELTGESIPKAIDALIAAYAAKTFHPALVK